MYCTRINASNSNYVNNMQIQHYRFKVLVRQCQIQPLKCHFNLKFKIDNFTPL